MRNVARRTKRSTEEYGHRVKSRAVNVHARRDSFSRLGATKHDFAHSSLRRFQDVFPLHDARDCAVKTPRRFGGEGIYLCAAQSRIALHHSLAYCSFRKGEHMAAYRPNDNNTQVLTRCAACKATVIAQNTYRNRADANTVCATCGMMVAEPPSMDCNYFDVIMRARSPRALPRRT